MQSITNIYNKICTIQALSPEIHDYINSLPRDEYCSLATIYILGRDGWNRYYEDTSELYSFVEEQEADGKKVTPRMLDDHFLTKEKKAEQLDTIYQYELSDAGKINHVYRHNWLSKKTDLIQIINKGLSMQEEAR